MFSKPAFVVILKSIILTFKYDLASSSIEPYITVVKPVVKHCLNFIKNLLMCQFEHQTNGIACDEEFSDSEDEGENDVEM